MSIAEMGDKYPVTLDFRSLINAKKRLRPDLQNIPPVVVLADIFMQEGSDGLEKLMERIASAGVAIVPDENFFEQISDEQRSLMEEERAAIMFGISIRSLHAMLGGDSFNGFDSQAWCDGYNRATAGTPFPSLQVKGGPIDIVATEDLTILRQLALEDKTLSFFFEHPYTMPNMLRRILEDLDVLPIICSMILPLYKERAQFLLSPQA